MLVGKLLFVSHVCMYVYLHKECMGENKFPSIDKAGHGAMLLCHDQSNNMGIKMKCTSRLNC